MGTGTERERNGNRGGGEQRSAGWDGDGGGDP